MKSVSTEILKTIYWTGNEGVSDAEIYKNVPSNCSKSSSSSHDNPPILQSIYPILDKININISNLNDRPLDVMLL